jgi:hypothetical protein
MVFSFPRHWPKSVHMLTFLISRPFRRSQPAPSTRLEVCPPALLGTANPLARRVLKWLQAGAPLASRRPDPAQHLRNVRDEFADTLSDIRTQHAGFLQHRVQRARSMRELWHLRSEIYGVISLHHSQHEAESRLAGLNRHFPTRSPRSGFMPLDA